MTMARLKRDKPDPRNRVLSIRASAAEIAYLKAEAAARGMALPEMIREALDEYIKRHKAEEKR